MLWRGKLKRILQQSASLYKPALTDLGSVRQVAHVAQHAAIGHGLLRGLMGLIHGVWTDQGEDVGQHGARQLPGVVAAGDCFGSRRGCEFSGSPRTPTGLEFIQEAHLVGDCEKKERGGSEEE
jgi:hypothetical protein